MFTNLKINKDNTTEVNIFDQEFNKKDALKTQKSATEISTAPSVAEFKEIKAPQPPTNLEENNQEQFSEASFKIKNDNNSEVPQVIQ